MVKEMTREEKLEKIKSLKRKANKLKKEADYYNALQLALKLVLNGTYGAISTQHFILYNNHVAGTITAEGRELTKTMDDVNEDYWYNYWHLDKDLHKKLSIKNVRQIQKGKEEVSIYGDSVTGDSIIVTDNGDFRIEDLYKKYSDKDSNDKEVLPVDFTALNWTKENGLTQSKVKNIIKHKTNKKLYKVKTKSGKEITVTKDHSMVIFDENNEKIILKPEEMKIGDKVLIL
jgi:DNA polymerase elongation subunit (family B)